jgi:ABC-type sugar transport system ATPase subunit
MQKAAFGATPSRSHSTKPVILISHDMPHVFELADRIHIMRLGRRVAVVTPRTHTRPEAVAIMTGATPSQLENALTTEGSVE